MGKDYKIVNKLVNGIPMAVIVLRPQALANSQAFVNDLSSTLLVVVDAAKKSGDEVGVYVGGSSGDLDRPYHHFNNDLASSCGPAKCIVVFDFVAGSEIDLTNNANIQSLAGKNSVCAICPTTLLTLLLIAVVSLFLCFFRC